MQGTNTVGKNTFCKNKRVFCKEMNKNLFRKNPFHIENETSIQIENENLK